MKKDTLSATDAALVDETLRGNDHAFGVLYNRYKGLVFVCISKMLQDNVLAEDFVQNVFMKALMTIRAQKYKEQNKFSSWIKTIAQNLVIDHFRLQKRKGQVVYESSSAFLQSELFQELLPVRSPEEIVIEKEQYARALAYINSLRPEQRETLALRLLGGHSFKEIAHARNCSINTSLGQMRYGLMNLRSMIAGIKPSKRASRAA